MPFSRTFFVCLLWGILLLSCGSNNVSAKVTTQFDKANNVNVTISAHPIVLVVSFDGFRYDYLNKTETPLFKALRASGVTVPYMEPVFPTMTFPNHQSIATGLYAESHGIVDNKIFDPKFNKTLSGYDDDPGFWNYHPDVLPIWIRNELAGEGRTSGCMMWAGSSQAYGPNNDLLPTYYYPRYDSSIPWEERVDTVISWMTNPTRPANLVFLYYDEPDSTGHAFGPDAPETIEQIRKADNRTYYLVEKLVKAGIFEQVNLIILSDHGMKGVSTNGINNITEIVESNLDLIEGVYGGTPVLQLSAKEGKADDLYDAFFEHRTTHKFEVFKKEAMKPSYFFSKSRRIMDLLLVAFPGNAFDDFYEEIESQNLMWNLSQDDNREYGVHGYGNEEPSMWPFFIGKGPAFNRNVTHRQPIKNVDIVPLLSSILGIPQPPNNGSWARIADLLRLVPPPTTTSTTKAPPNDDGTTTPGSGSMIYFSSWILAAGMVLSLAEAKVMG